MLCLLQRLIQRICRHQLLYLICLVWFAVALGALLGGGSVATRGGRKSFGDILLGALIGGIAGGVGAGIGNIVAKGLGFASTGGAVAGFFGNASLSVTGFTSGLIVGATGGFAAGFTGGLLGGLAAGKNIGNALMGGLRAGLTSAVLAGIGAGIKVRKAGGNFWSGKGATHDLFAPPGTSTEVGKDLEYSNEYAKKFSDEHFGEVKGLKKLHADGTTFPKGYEIREDRVFSPKGQEVLGVTKYVGNGQSNVYLAKAAFSSKEQLFGVLEHEYIHVTHNLMISQKALTLTIESNAQGKSNVHMLEISAYNWNANIGIGYHIDKYLQWNRHLGNFSWKATPWFDWLPRKMPNFK